MSKHNTFFNKALSLLLTAVMIFSLIPAFTLSVSAASGGNVIDMSDANPPFSGTSWTYSNNVYTLLHGADVTVTGSTNNKMNRITVADNAIVTVRFVSVSIDVSENNFYAFRIGQNAKVTLILESGDSVIKSGNRRPGIEVPAGSDLKIYGSGKLTATGGEAAAGIGTSRDVECGSITIYGGNVVASAGEDGFNENWRPDSELAILLHDAGFLYDENTDMLYSRKDAPQYNLGYSYFYDEGIALISANISVEPIYFPYNGKEWLIEIWKGQYGFETGAEIGVYNRSVNGDLVKDRLSMNYRDLVTSLMSFLRSSAYNTSVLLGSTFSPVIDLLELAKEATTFDGFYSAFKSAYKMAVEITDTLGIGNNDVMRALSAIMIGLNSKMYDVVPENEMLRMSYTLKDVSAELFSRNSWEIPDSYDDKHWWLTGFELGGYTSNPHDLTMEVTIWFPTNDMRIAFLAGYTSGGTRMTTQQLQAFKDKDEAIVNSFKEFFSNPLGIFDYSNDLYQTTGYSRGLIRMGYEQKSGATGGYFRHSAEVAPGQYAFVAEFKGGNPVWYGENGSVSQGGYGDEYGYPVKFTVQKPKAKQPLFTTWAAGTVNDNNKDIVDDYNDIKNRVGYTFNDPNELDKLVKAYSGDSTLVSMFNKLLDDLKDIVNPAFNVAKNAMSPSETALPPAYPYYKSTASGIGGKDAAVTISGGTVYAVGNPAITAGTNRFALTPAAYTWHKPSYYNPWVPELSSGTYPASAFVLDSTPIVILQAANLPTPSLMASVEEIDFGAAAPGYSQQAAKNITIRNTGSVPVTLSQVTAENYVISSLPAGTVLNPSGQSGDSFTFSVRPYPGLAVGDYTSMFVVSCAEGVNASVTLKFSVDPNAVDFYTQVASYADATEDMVIALTHDISLTKRVKIPNNRNGAKLTITSAGETPVRITRAYELTYMLSTEGLFVVESLANVVFENITVDDRNSGFEHSVGALVSVTGRFTMNEGTALIGNSGKNGRGVFISDMGVFTMNDGRIEGNHPDDNNGGGVHVGGVFTMNGGMINGNSGSGVSGTPNGRFTMNGGYISSNSGGGVVGLSKVTVGGHALIRNNTASGSTAPYNLVVDGPFQLSTGENAPEKMNVGVTRTTGDGVIVSSGAKPEYVNYFHADAPGRAVVSPVTGQLSIAHQYSTDVAPESRTFSTSAPGYSNSGMAQVFTITNTSINTITGLTAALANGAGSAFEIVAPGIPGTINYGYPNNSVTVTVRPKAGLASQAVPYSDTLRIRGDNDVVIDIPLSFRVSAPAIFVNDTAQSKPLTSMNFIQVAINKELEEGRDVTVTGSYVNHAFDDGLMIEIPAGRTVTWAAEISLCSTSNFNERPIGSTVLGLRGDGEFVLPVGGLIERPLDDSKSSDQTLRISSGSSVSVTVSGGTIRNYSRFNTAIDNGGTGDITITGGLVEGTIETRISGDVIVRGGTIKKGGSGMTGPSNAIEISHGGDGVAYSDVIISGGTLGGIYHGGTGDIIISGGTIAAFDDQAAIGVVNTSSKNPDAGDAGNIIISGGTISTRNSEAIRHIRPGAVAILGGEIKCGPDWETMGLDAVNCTVNDACAFAWDWEAGNTRYAGDDDDDLTVKPAGTTAQWIKSNGVGGVAFARNAKTGFIPVEGVTVIVPCGEGNHTPGAEATCEEPQHCADCEEVLAPAKGHSYGVWTVTLPATCFADGEETGICANDHAHTETRAISARPEHSFTNYTGSTATCTAPGVSTAYCDNEGCTEFDLQAVSEYGHDMPAEWTARIPASCESTGVEYKRCSRYNVCGHEETQPIAALGHSWVSNNDGTHSCATAGGCGADVICSPNGFGETCVICGYITPDPCVGGHDFQNYVSNNNATCTADRTETGACSRCSETDTRPVSGTALGHNMPSVWTEKTAASCETTGEEYRRCLRYSDCGHEETRPIAALDHNWTSNGDGTHSCATAGGCGEANKTCAPNGIGDTCSKCGYATPAPDCQHTDTRTDTTPATCTAAGSEDVICNDCNEIVSSTAVPALGHSWGAWTVTIPPTAITTGVETRICNRDSAHTETRTIPATGSPIGGGGGSTNAEPIQTIPAADGGVEVSYKQSGDTVTLDMPVAKVDEIIGKTEGGVSTLDVSGVENVTEVVIPVSALSKLADARLNVEIVLPQGAITLDADVLGTVAATGGNITVSLSEVKAESLTDAQQEQVRPGDVVLDISLFAGNTQIHDLGGTLTVTVPYDGPLPVAVWYLNDAGELKKVDCIYDPASKTVMFKTDHLSLYVLGQDTAWQNPFTDVPESAWYFADVEFVSVNGLMNGTGIGMFSPDNPLTRGMIVTILYRMEGEPDVSGLSNTFSDVAADKYYSDAVIWAAANGVVSGYGSGKFGPEDNISRQDLAVIITRFAGFADMKLPEIREYPGFIDDADIANYAKEVLERFFEAGIVNGKPGNQLDPKGQATRAEAAAMLSRFLEGANAE